MRADHPSTLTPQQLRILTTIFEYPGASLASYPILDVAAAEALSLIAPGSGDNFGFHLTERGQAMIGLILSLPVPEKAERFEIELPGISLPCPRTDFSGVTAVITRSSDERSIEAEHNA